MRKRKFEFTRDHILQAWWWLAQHLGHTPRSNDLGNILRHVSYVEFEKLGECAIAAGLQPNQSRVRSVVDRVRHRDKALAAERAAFLGRQEARKVEAMALRVLTNGGKREASGKILPGNWAADAETLRHEVLRRYHNLSSKTRGEVFTAALRLKKEHAAQVRHVPVEEYLRGAA